MTFKQFLEQKQNKPWVAKKDDVLRLWNSANPETPLNVEPVRSFHKGSRFDQDGIRITGSSQFINSVLGKIKDFLFYSNHPSLDLDVKYRQIQKRNITDRASYACYINVVHKK